MQKKMLWGLGVLALLICTAFVFMTVRNRAEIRQLKEGTAAAEKPLEDSNKRKPVAKADEQPPAEPGFKWVWHNDHWDKVPIDAPDTWQGEPHTVDVSTPAPVPVSVKTHLPLLVEIENPIIKKQILLRTINVDGIDIDWASLSPDELAETIAKLERREITEPAGYYYRRRSDNSLLFDESGYPILHKIGEPFISVAWTMEFRPPQEVYEEYRQLARRRNLLDPSPELDNIRAQMEEMRRTYAGPLPVTFGISCAGNDIDAQVKRAHETIDQLKAGFFRQLGIEYLLSRY
ncbi:hypothetical protein C6501_14705 [Candidatus Poribacteria bacterium]|nr:MAG: hypothetical protein C6501_14705 [Candidatus Poribacteria bacterium]